MIDGNESESSENSESEQLSISSEDGYSTLSEYNDNDSDSISQSSVNCAATIQQKEKKQNVFRDAFVSRRNKIRKDKYSNTVSHQSMRSTRLS